jgi:hypothetical protein
LTEKIGVSFAADGTGPARDPMTDDWMAIMRSAVAAIAILAATASELVIGCSSSRPSTTPTPPATTTVVSTVGVAATPTGDAAPPPVTDADAHGFTVFGEGARCWASDEAQMFMRTDKSALVVCRSEINQLYYRGYRISDGASIELHDVSRQLNGFVVVNAADGARYVITSDGFQLSQNGTVVVSESAVESGPTGWAGSSPGAPAPATAATVVLGSAAAMGPESRGYGSEQPAVISMGSCPNAISKIVWQDWGSPEADGSGLGCVQYGQPPRYPLVASNIVMCQGVLAYRTLQISTNPPQDICSG